jgi:hypothetical protein
MRSWKSEPAFAVSDGVFPDALDRATLPAVPQTDLKLKFNPGCETDIDIFAENDDSHDDDDEPQIPWSTSAR